MCLAFGTLIITHPLDSPRTSSWNLKLPKRSRWGTINYVLTISSGVLICSFNLVCGIFVSAIRSVRNRGPYFALPYCCGRISLVWDVWNYPSKLWNLGMRGWNYLRIGRCLPTCVTNLHADQPLKFQPLLTLSLSVRSILPGYLLEIFSYQSEDAGV